MMKAPQNQAEVWASMCQILLILVSCNFIPGHVTARLNSTPEFEMANLNQFNNRMIDSKYNTINQSVNSTLTGIGEEDNLDFTSGDTTPSSDIRPDVGIENRTCPLYCKCNEEQRTVLCNNTKLAWIPRIPSYTRSLTIQNANLYQLNASTFRNISKIYLTYLALVRCHIQEISNDTFKYIAPNLEALDLSYNNIWPEQIRESLCVFAHRGLVSLDLNSMNLKHIQKDFFRCWQGSKLKVLYLKGNKLRTFSGKVISPLQHLEVLGLQVNRLSAINDLVLLHNLQTLTLSKNRFKHLPAFLYKNGSTILPNLKRFDFGRNYLTSISATDFRGLTNLEILSLNSNKLSALPDNIMSEMPNLKNLDLNDNRIRSLSSFSFNSSSMSVLDFGSNTFPFSTADVDNMFIFSKSLNFLILTNNKVNVNDRIFKAILSPLKNLTRLILENVNLQYFPTLFDVLPQLNELILSNNNIDYWQPEIFLPAKNLAKLYIDHCKIQIINEPSFPQHIWTNFKKVNFGENPFSCTCDLLWFRNWLDNTHTTVVGWPYVKTYICGSPKAWQGKPLVYYHPTKKSCSVHENMYIILGASLGSGFAVIMILSLLSYRYRWYIRYFCAVMKAKRKNYNRLPPTLDYTYDAFVIYSAKDRAWVVENLIPIVEYREGYKLCVQDRDFVAGRLIIDNIMESMENSRKIIIILSNNFAKSEWCKWETAMAMHKFTDSDSDMLVLITIDEISAENLHRSLTQLLQRTYVDWQGARDCRDLFWKQLLSSLKPYMPVRNNDE